MNKIKISDQKSIKRKRDDDTISFSSTKDTFDTDKIINNDNKNLTEMNSNNIKNTI